MEVLNKEYPIAVKKRVQSSRYNFRIKLWYY
jgi:hypothetical protein